MINIKDLMYTGLELGYNISESFLPIAEKLGYVKLEEYEKLQKRIVNLEADIHKAKQNKNK